MKVLSTKLIHEIGVDVMKIRTFFPAAVVAISLPACQTVPEPPDGVLTLEGFEAFATPRAFDGPGTIFRIDPDRKRLFVDSIAFKTSGGQEFLPSVESSRELSLAQVAESIGAAAGALPVKVTADLSSKRLTSIKATSAERSRTSDKDVEDALRQWATTAKPAPGNEYYLIRETVATLSLTYKVSKSWLASLGLSAESLNRAGYKGEVKNTGGDSLEMDAVFTKPLNVWYKAEKVSFKPMLGVGAGSNQYIVERTPVSGSAIGL